MSELFAKLGIDWKLLIANAITFGIVLWLLRKFAYKPLMDVMDKRRSTIDAGLNDAQKAKDELQAMQSEKAKVLTEAKREAQKILQDAITVADQRRQDLITKADHDVQTMMVKAKQQMEDEKQQVMSSAQAELADLVVAATEKVVAGQLDEKLQRSLADQTLKHISKPHAR